MPGSLRALAVSDAGTLVVGGDERAADVDNRAGPHHRAQGRRRRTDGPARRDRGAGQGRPRDCQGGRGGGKFVAVGAASGDAGIWTSATASAGRRRAGAILGGPRRQSLGDVAHGRRGWLAVGGTMTDASSTEPLLVTSADGAKWRRVPASVPSPPAGDHYFLAPHAVAAGQSGYVMAGEDRGPATVVPVLWFSPDLKRYTRAAKLPAGGIGVRLHDVSATSSGYVAVGGAGTAERETGVVWVSADGVNWTARKPVLPPGATSAGLRHVVLYGGHIVAAGTALTEDGRRAFGAASADNGSTWEFSLWLPADGSSAVQDLAATAEGVVAVGWHGVPGAGDSVAWTSEDGLNWQRHAPARAAWTATAPSGSARWRSPPAVRSWRWAAPPPTAPTTSPCGARPSPPPDDRPFDEGVREAGGEREPYELVGGEPAGVGGVGSGGERAAGPVGERGQVVADLVDDAAGSRTFDGARQTAGDDAQPGLLQNLARHRLDVGFAGFDPAAGDGPEALAGRMATADEKDPPGVDDDRPDTIYAHVNKITST